MTLYALAVALHVLAAALWLGHMLVWSLFAGPALKRLEPASTAALLRERSLHLGGLGWPALAVLVVTGLYMLWERGVGPLDLVTGAAYDIAGGTALLVKVVLVLAMILYQAVFGHRSTNAIYLDMVAGLAVLLAAVMLHHGVG
jgi:uncharacterized membrane protein